MNNDELYAEDVKLRVEQVRSLPFLAVTVCNNNPIRESQLKFSKGLHDLIAAYRNENESFNHTIAEYQIIQEDFQSLALLFSKEEYIEEITESSGLRVVIHDPKRMSFPEDEGIFVSPYALTHIGVKRGCQYRCLGEEVLCRCSCLYVKFATQFKLHELFSNVGGTLGLYMGFSLLTIVEIVVLLYDLFRAAVLQRNGNNILEHVKRNSFHHVVKTSICAWFC
ncbi:hypothetical protein HELRODRAFT_168359 [Helobdella robusta]|uniref:Uncharacterized protein n=1 Tax=Helobdella robusta TaxID=6412 RepID=T1F0G8_HELRO|nr:hypothetical protein HELRODRAFT_168359 [Helobdella robusta]ESO09378.1 hypothetical protein HELRODRAFT_168359 [Helobdella robusta]